MGARAATFAVSILLASSARAAGLGDACAVTTDCAPALRCIGGRCLSTTRGSPRPRTRSDVALFGEGRGYSGAIVGADVFGLVGTTAFFGVAASMSTDYRTGWQIAAVVPFAFGPIVHATHQRWGAAIVSFFGWASLDMSAFAASLVQGSCDECAALGTAIELGLLAIGGSVLTWLDAWMARDLGPTMRARAAWFPIVAPTQEGAVAGVGGVF